MSIVAEPVRKDVHTAGIPVLCASCEARHRGICGALDADQLVHLAKTTHKSKASPGQPLIGESTEIQTYANVMRGVVKLSKILEDGRQQLVGLQFAPDFLGRLYGEEHEVNADAGGDVELCVFPRSTLEGMVEESPELKARLLQQKLRELDEARDWMVTLGRKTAQEKVASLLVLIAERIDPRRRLALHYELPLTRHDIADFLGLTIETVSRQMTRLKQMHVIELEGYRIVTIPSIDRLRALCG